MTAGNTKVSKYDNQSFFLRTASCFAVFRWLTSHDWDTREASIKNMFKQTRRTLLVWVHDLIKTDKLHLTSI